MKKRFLTFILAIATMLMCIFGFSACGGNVEFKINFVVENEVYATVSTSGNEVISMPENPTKDDYTFDGWYWDENTWEKPFTANSLLDAPLSSDMKVYAKFNKNHTHEYTPTTTEPTCTEKGLITYTCSCGDSYTEDIPAIGHDEKTHEAKAPTCTEIGWEEYVTCERDGCGYSTYKEILATGVHTWDKGEETKAPTCTKEGETTYTCTVCKTTTKTEPIDKLRHEYAEKWSSSATYHWHECKCGDKDGEEKHTAGAPATATTPQTCTVCGYVLQVETGILFNTLTVNGTNVYGKVSNNTEIFSFINEVTVKGNATYIVDVNISCKDPIESKTVELSVGDNKFYVLEKIGNNVKLFTVTIRRRPMYDVTFNVNGGTAVDKQVIEEDYLATKPETTRTGYTFTGWDYDFTQPITEHTKITASWVANKDTKYTVNYYLQNIDDNEYTLCETVELTGTTDTTVYGETERYVHFTCNQNMGKISGNINPDGGQVLSVYYTRDSYDIVVNANNVKAGTSTQINDMYKYDKELTLTATTNAGYTWLGWYDGETLACATEEFTFNVEKDVTYTATWSANTDTKYTVIYYLQNLEDDNYTPYETVELKGETDTTATAEIKEYTHFTYNKSKSVISGNINGDGNRVLSVYYTRDSYKITTTRNNTKAGTVSGESTYKYDKQITLTATTNAGYTWLGWYDGETLACESEEFTFKAEKDVTYTATWSANTDTKYTVIYYWQNVGDDNYTPHETVELTGETDTPTAEVDIKEYTHFTYNESVSTISGNIDGDEKRVLSVYYTRDKYIISTARNDTKAGNISGNGIYKFDKQITLTATTNIGYTWLGWYDGERLVCETEEVIFKAEKDVTYTATWSIKAEMSNFNFTADVTTCSITGIKDETVTEIIIPDYVTCIGKSAFYKCSSLAEITLPFVGATKDGTSNTYFGYIFGASSSSHNSSYVPTSLKKVTITGGDIGSSAFRSCSSLTSVEIGDSVTSIGRNAFDGCSSLTSVEIGDSVTSIGYYAFYYCSSLTSVEIPDSVTTIGFSAFRNCSSLTSVVIGGCVTSIGERAFYNCDSLTSVVIPDSVTSIGDFAFYYCYKLVEVVNKSAYITVTKGNSSNGYVGYYALAVYNSGDALTSKLSNDNGYIIYTDGAEKILVGYNGTETDLVLPSYITKINQYAFIGCDSLTSVVIPDSVTSIGEYAFYYCSSLTSIKVSENNTAYQSIEGNLYSKDGKTLIQYAIGKTATSFTIPNSVTSIGYSAFGSCDSLTSVVIGDSVTSIGDRAFQYCSSLTSVVIGDSVTSIGNTAFAYCESLTSVEIPDSVTTIGDSAFSWCSSLTSVVIGDSVTSIGDDAFEWCTSLTSITFKDTSTWYRTTSSSDWSNKTGGTSTSVKNSSTNATYFKSTYHNYYWYKK